jgi:hypothetical protein
MATISFVDWLKIEKFLTPSATSPGYVLDFTNAGLEKFIGSITEIDIYEKDKYDKYGTSKASRLRYFFEKESDHIVGKVLLELVEYQKILAPQYHSLEIQPDEIVGIANKLLNGGVGEEENATGTVHFQEIREKILSELKQAEFTIWIAVAWFTDPMLFDCLITKKHEGLNIQIIINDDNTNNLSGLDYNQFETYKLPPLGSRSINRMHHKFCIIDFKKVIHGSYNWTKSARYNGETIEIAPGHNKAKQFSQEFMKLKVQGMNQ